MQRDRAWETTVDEMTQISLNHAGKEDIYNSGREKLGMYIYGVAFVVPGGMDTS